jgi:hypothetical protein
MAQALLPMPGHLEVHLGAPVAQPSETVDSLMARNKYTKDPRTLPLWAQQLITRLQLDLEHKDNQLAHAVGLVPSAIEVDPARAGQDRPRLFLHERAVVRYTIPGGEIEIRWDRDELYVTALSATHGKLFVVAPGASNVVHLRFVDPPAMPAGGG